MVKWIVCDKWHIESDPPRFMIGKRTCGNAHHTYYRYTLKDAAKLVGEYASADEAKAAAEVRA